jgi:hypothetical protein
MNLSQTTTESARIWRDPRYWREKIRYSIEATGIIICALILTAFVIVIGLLLLTGNDPHNRDVVSFWTAGRQILHHNNPYDSATTLAIEHSVGYSNKTDSFIMRNPPWALALVMPLGLFGLRAATPLWSLALLMALALSIRLLGPMQSRPRDRLQYAGYCFAPVMLCVLAGQSALFALLGLVLFLHFRQSRPLVAGVALWLCAAKPHLFLPFAAVLLLWIVVERRYRVLAGAALSLAASSAIAWAYDPAIWTQYNQLMHSPVLRQEFIPCLSIALRLTTCPQAMWIQYIPAALGSAWAINYYWSRRRHWDWMQNGAPLMLVSLMVSPYSWITDQCLLVPALLVGVSRASSRAQIGALMLANAAIEINIMQGKGLHSKLFLWTTPVWLAWYLFVSKKRHSVDLGAVDARQYAGASSSSEGAAV